MAKKAARKATPSKPAGKNGAHRPPTDHAYFLSLEVSNIRCFGAETQKLDLSKPDGSWAPWTIILGNNGTGKSTLLQMIGGLKEATERLYAINDPANCVVEITDREKPPLPPMVILNGMSRCLDMIVEGSRLNFSQHSGIDSGKVEIAFRTSAIKGKYGVVISTVGDFPVYSDDRLEVMNRLNFQSPTGLIPESRVVGYGAWRRLGQTELANGIRHALSFTDHLFDDSSDLVNAEEWLLRADYASAKKSTISEQLKQRLNAVRTTLLQLFPDGEVAGIRISDPDKRHTNPRVLFATPFGEVELRHLGYGYQSLITWVVDFAARMFAAYPDSPQPLAEPAVCLVDEIDLHLHPTWQRKVMRYLSERFPKTQFIATAHSPLIVQAAAEMQANVAVLRRDGDHVVIENNPVAVQGWRADQILASELFDVPLRSEASEEIVKERTRLLSQAKLSKADKSKLQELEAKMAAFPVGSTPAERSLNDRLKSAVDLLEKVARKPQS